MYEMPLISQKLWTSRLGCHGNSVYCCHSETHKIIPSTDYQLILGIILIWGNHYAPNHTFIAKYCHKIPHTEDGGIGTICCITFF